MPDQAETNMRHWILAVSIVFAASASAFAIEMFGDWTSDSRDGIYTITHPTGLVRNWPCDLTPVTRGRREMRLPVAEHPQTTAPLQDNFDSASPLPTQALSPRCHPEIEDYRPSAGGLFPAAPLDAE